MTFDEMITFIIKRIEGGYANDSRDNGGETKYGISEKAYPELKGRIKDLTLDEAKRLYRRDYFTPSLTSKYPAALRILILDGAINHGVLGNNKLIQKALNKLGCKLVVDGVIGPKTLAAVKSVEPIMFKVAYLRTRQAFYRNHPDYTWAGEGWENRLFLIASA